MLAATRAALDAATFAEVWTAGRAMEPAQLAALVAEIGPGHP